MRNNVVAMSVWDVEVMLSIEQPTLGPGGLIVYENANYTLGSVLARGFKQLFADVFRAARTACRFGKHRLKHALQRHGVATCVP